MTATELASLAEGADLRTTIGPLQLKNPVIASSCELTRHEHDILACLDAGAGAVVTKSINENSAASRQLRIADYAALRPDGTSGPWGTLHGDETLLCRSGLAPEPIDTWLDRLQRCQDHAATLDAHVIGSITIADPDAAPAIARTLAQVVPAIELNIGAPHAREAAAVTQLTSTEAVQGTVRAVRDSVSVPLIVKLPGQVDNPAQLAAAARNAGADAVTLIGRLNGFWPDTHTGRPVLGSWGAVGNSGMLPISLYWASKTYAADKTTPVIGTNGVRTADDILRFLLAGARAVEVATLLILNGPRALTKLIADLNRLLRGSPWKSLDDLIGIATDAARPYSAIPPHEVPAEPWRDLEC